jgi:hypothetical protein
VARQIDLIRVPSLMGVEKLMAAQSGGYLRASCGSPTSR